MVFPGPRERKPVAWQWYRVWRPLQERPAMGSCITVCNLAEHECEKYIFFAAAAEGCIHCLRQQYVDDPHLVHAMSDDGQYAALDYAIWEAQKNTEDANVDAVLDFLRKAGCRSKYYKNVYVLNDASSRAPSTSGTHSGRMTMEASL